MTVGLGISGVVRQPGQRKGSLALAMLEGWRVRRLWIREIIHKVFCHIVYTFMLS